MAEIGRPTPRLIISKNNLRSAHAPVVSNVKCVRLHRGKHGFGLALKYCFSYANITMDEEENMLRRNSDDRDDASGSDADISSESSDTPCSQNRPNHSSETIDKVFIKWVLPRSPAEQAGLMQGDEVVNVNNSAVYGQKTSEIENVLTNRGSIDVDIVERNVKRHKKGKHKLRWDDYDVYGCNNEEVSDHGSSLSLTSCSSDNATSPSSMSPPALPEDRCFVVTYGKPSYDQDTHQPRTVLARPFALPSYSDEEPEMESKSICLSVSTIKVNDVDVKNTNSESQRPQALRDSTTHKSQAVSANKVSFGLSNSTSSSVLVESLDNNSTSNQPSCVTVTKATYTTLASPQLTRGESGYGSKEDGSDTCDHRLLVPSVDNNVWELRTSSQLPHIRSRSPNPSQRRVSYLMATEGNPSWSSGNWTVKPVLTDEQTNNNLLPLKEESSEPPARVTFHYQGDTDEHGTLRVPGEAFVLGEPVAFEAKEDDDGGGNDPSVGDEPSAGDEQPKSVAEEKRHSLKRKCSIAIVFEVEKEGYLSRKLGASHGRRSWKHVYVILKAHVMYIYKEKPDQVMNNGQEEKPISIKSCIVDIAYDYRKRENVFRLTTYNGSQYLFQAKDKNSMMSWIEAIQRNNNPDEDKSGVTSENLIVRRKKNMDNEMSSGQTTSKPIPPASLKISGLKKSLSFKSTSGSQSSFKMTKKGVDGESGKPAWRNKVVSKMKKIGQGASSPIPLQPSLSPGYSVGVRLERCPMSKTNPTLPFLVEHCCKVVEIKGLELVGIYRVPGNSANVAALEEELNARMPDTIDFEEQKWNDANNMGSLLKKFLRKLPEGLVTSELYGSFIESNRKEGEDRMWALKHLIQQLPCAYGETLRTLIRHLKKVSEHSDKNKMEIRNLAIVFGPTIVRTGEDNMMTMVNDMSDRFRIVESFIKNFDWFFDSEPIPNGASDSMSPTSPPVEEFSQHLVSVTMLSSIEQAAATYEENEANSKVKGPSIKLPKFKSLIRHSSDSSKKSELTSDNRASPETVENGKVSPVSLSPFDNNHRPGDGSQPGSPTSSRRKVIKRHHSSTNISSVEVHDDFDRSKSEGEDEESMFHSKPRLATKAYQYARPPPPSYRELQSKGSFRGLAQPSPPLAKKETNVSPDSNENRDFNSLSDETKRRLLSVTLRQKVNERKKQKTTEELSAESLNASQNAAPEYGQKAMITKTFVVSNNVPSKKLSDYSTGPSIPCDGQMVDAEPQLKPSEIKKRFESYPDVNEHGGSSIPDNTIPSDPAPQLRRRDGNTPSSSSRNFKIYSNAEVNFSQYRPNQINEWVRDLGQDKNFNIEFKERGKSERGRSRDKADETMKGTRRSASVSRTSFGQDDEEMVMKRRSLSWQDINVAGDDEILNRTRSSSKSSDSTDTSDEETDHLDASSKDFDEKLRGLMQKNKLENKSKTDIQARRASQSRPPGIRSSKTPIEKMHAMDPTSKIQSGAVSNMKSLFESGAAHQHLVKSRSSSLSSNSSASIMSNDTQRKKSSCSSNTLSDADVKRRVWETDSTTGEAKKQWKEPVWIAKERAIKNLRSENECLSSDDNNNNNVRNEKKPDTVLKQYSRSASLPIKQTGYLAKDMIISSSQPGRNVVNKRITNEKHSQRATVKIMPTVQKVTPVNTNISSVHIGKPEYKIPSSACRGGDSADFETHPSHKVIYSTNSEPLDAVSSSQKQKPTTRSRRRIMSDSNHRTASRQPSGRTFTAPILGTVVTTTKPFELSGFAIKPESRNRNARLRDPKKSEKQEMQFAEPWKTRKTLDVPRSSSRQHKGPPGDRKTPSLLVPEVDNTKRLSTDRSLLDLNALHIKELLDEMNTEHSLTMERQKSDTISINAQQSAKKRAMRRRLSLGQDRENGVLVASCVSPSNARNDRGRNETKTPLSTQNELQRKISTVKWVGVSS